jgi:hypothetical protein
MLCVKPPTIIFFSSSSTATSMTVISVSQFLSSSPKPNGSGVTLNDVFYATTKSREPMIPDKAIVQMAVFITAILIEVNTEG